MSDTKIIDNHVEHLAKLTTKAGSKQMYDMKKLIDYLIMFKACK
jgi:hypothetical protein